MAPRPGVGAPELPRQQDRVGDLVELEPAPVRRAVQVPVLRQAPVGLLLQLEEVVERAAGGRAIAGGDLRRGDLVEVARPDEVVRAGVADELAPDPGHRRRGDPGPAVRLVLQRSHDHERRVVEPLVPGGGAGPAQAAQVVVPAVAVAAIGGGEAGVQRGARGAERALRVGREPERERQRAAAAAPGQRRARGLRHVALQRRGVTPVHAEVRARGRSSRRWRRGSRSTSR